MCVQNLHSFAGLMWNMFVHPINFSSKYSIINAKGIKTMKKQIFACVWNKHDLFFNVIQSDKPESPQVLQRSLSSIWNRNLNQIICDTELHTYLNPRSLAIHPLSTNWKFFINATKMLLRGNPMFFFTSKKLSNPLLCVNNCCYVCTSALY